MGNFIRAKWPLLMLAGLSALSVGMVAAVVGTMSFGPAGELSQTNGTNRLGDNDSLNADSAVLKLATIPPEQRTEVLTTLIETKPDLESARARYLLATDLINQGRGGQALPLLEKLEQNYRPLAPYVMLKRAQAQAAAGEQAMAEATWSSVIENYDQHPASAEALFHLGKTQPEAWDQVISQFPEHPRAVDVALKRLQANAVALSEAHANESGGAEAKPLSNEKELLLLVAEHGLHHPSYGNSLVKLVASYGDDLTPEQWQMVGFGFWEAGDYSKAGEAYAKAPPSPLTQYRAGRGLQLGGQKVLAIATYRKLAQAFPNTPEAANGLFKLAGMLPDKAALEVLDQIIATIPDRAGDALLLKAERLEDLNSPGSARDAKASILSQYSGSDAAAKLRFSRAQTAAEAGSYQDALNWGQQIVSENPDSELAPEASFWVGKWASRLNQSETAQKAFTHTLSRYPESYFAWRSAVYLGWDVGDFQDVRYRNPEVVLPEQRLALPAGSDTLQELYLMGQDEDAWVLWQSEFETAQDPTVAEQFTDGIIRIGVGDNLDGIYELSSLAWREDQADLKAFETLKTTSSYWQGVYPFPFSQIIQTWSQQRQLNPLLVTALIRQESRFQPKIRSSAGALGLMQVMPATADWILGQIDEDNLILDQAEDNVKLGTWYLDYTHREYDGNSLFAVASYNAGPGNVAKWIDRFGYADPDDFVESIPFGETHNYVKAVFGGYWNYLRLYNPTIAGQMEQLANN